MLSCTYETSYFPPPQRFGGVFVGATAERALSLDTASVCEGLPRSHRCKYRNCTGEPTHPSDPQTRHPPHKHHHAWHL